MPWLMKAEPDTRIVKGKDVKFSVDDFEEIGTSPWDGVRNHEAKLIMKEKMKLGDKVLFYHSNCKMPGVFALAEVAKEGYPDYTAWDPSHPYYDPKSSQDNPTWYMVSVKFVKRLAHPVTLAFIKSLVGLSAPPAGVEYIGKDGLEAIQGMALVNRGRLSVQPVEEEAYDAIVALGDKGGFESFPSKGKKRKEPAGAEEETSSKKVSAKKSDSKKTDAKKADSNKADSKKADSKKADSKKTDSKQAGSKPTNSKQTNSKVHASKEEEEEEGEEEPKPKKAKTTNTKQAKPVVEGTRRSGRLKR